jgi:hypothetical protein
MNNCESFSKPILIEPGAKYFLNETLKKCHIFKENYKNSLLNIILFISFLLILGIILLVKYKGKLSSEEIKEKELEKKKYILSKIKNYQDSRRREQQELISGLPHWDNEY